ncbi:ankyrin repeat domain-containing protein [Francisella sp. LA112445]|uniref:ankyrin repeat domain-containing protein n=1 Tax=Francisella sp. LA112445 TaxID=1395624 RepID=UPI001788C7C5|nr:ankyrin repeat domain-containing protein [Francisella sp. LA112445]QIW09716.1 ankyrin repeat domain-containing protein [Francisella sp. LA112445]
MNLLKLQKALGYKVREIGMCHGIAYMAIQAIIRNQLGTYIKRIEILDLFIKSQGNDEEKAINDLVKEIKKAESKRADKDHIGKLTDYEKMLLDIVAWLDGVQIYHGLDFKSIGKSEYYINYQDYRRSTNFFGGNDEGYQKIFLQSKDVCLLTKAKISEIYHKVLYSNKSIAFSITRPGHIIAIGKSKSFNSIYLINHNQHSIISNADQAFNLIYKACFDGVVSEDKAISILEFTDTPQIDIYIYFNDNQKLTDKNIQDLLYISLREGHTEAVKKYTDCILETKKYHLLSINDKINAPGLYVAMQNDHAETVEAFIKIIAQSSIPNQMKTKLLLAEQDGFSGLYIALHNGHIETIKTYIETIIIIKCNIDKYELISACSDNNCTPGLFSALANGYVEGIETYIKTIDSISDVSINKFKKQIFTAENINGTPGLFMALANDHAEAVKTYIKAVANIKDTTINKQDLLAAIDNGAPGLYIALEKGHTEAIKIYIEEICNISNINKYQLLHSKNSRGTPGLFAALRNGHTDTIKTYIKAISNIQDDSINSHKQEVLAAKHNNVSGLFIALQNNHVDTIKIYIETIININDSTINKQELLTATSHLNNPGLFTIMQEDKVDAVEAYIEAIEEINNPMIDKGKLLSAISINNISGLYQALLTNKEDSMISTYLKIKDNNGYCANTIMNSKVDKVEIKRLLLKWAYRYKQGVNKNIKDYPLLIKLLSYNRSSIFKKAITASMKQLCSHIDWYQHGPYK